MSIELSIGIKFILGMYPYKLVLMLIQDGRIYLRINIGAVSTKVRTLRYYYWRLMFLKATPTPIA